MSRYLTTEEEHHKILFKRYYIVGLNRVSDAIMAWREKQGFTSPSSFTETDLMLSKLALIHSEVSEATEEVRKGTIEGFGEELADIVIRVLDMTAALGIDIEREIATKMITNEGRPHMHGARA